MRHLGVPWTGSRATDMSASIAIITALQREVYPLVKDWSEKSGGVPDGCACFVNAGTAVLCGGIGYRSARIAAEVMVEKFHPEMLVSAGLAGALVPGMRVGQVIEPAQILDL